MVLVISELEDTCSTWLISEFTKRGFDVQHIFPDELIIDSEINLYITNIYQSLKLKTKDGRVINNNNVELLINRIYRFPRPSIDINNNKDIIYTAEEIRATIVPWIHSFNCPIYNKPHPYSSFGLVMHPLKWKSIASKFALKPAYEKLENGKLSNDYKNSSRILVIGNRIIHLHGKVVPKDIESGLLRLSTFLDQSLIEYEFQNNNNKLELISGNTFPCLQEYGQKLIEDLINQL